MKTQRMQYKRGMVLNENQIYVGRPTIYGNQYASRTTKSAFDVIPVDDPVASYKEAFLKRVETDLVFRDQVKRLKGKTLCCWCALHKPCHSDVLIEWLESQP